jgi:hypothetical protein
MADPMVELWTSTVTTFRWHVVEYSQMEDIKDETKEKLGKLPAVIDRFIRGTGNPTTLYTRDNLVLLVKCWKDFYTWTYGTRYWHNEIPEWSFMISQFHIFVNEFEMQEIRELLHTTGGVDLPTGRQTFISQTQNHGRNSIVSRDAWVYCCITPKVQNVRVIFFTNALRVVDSGIICDFVDKVTQKLTYLSDSFITFPCKISVEES